MDLIAWSILAGVAAFGIATSPVVKNVARGIVDFVRYHVDHPYSAGIRVGPGDVAHARRILPELARRYSRDDLAAFDELAATAHPDALALVLADTVNVLADVVGGYRYQPRSLVIEHIANLNHPRTGADA